VPHVHIHIIPRHVGDLVDNDQIYPMVGWSGAVSVRFPMLGHVPHLQLEEGESELGPSLASGSRAGASDAAMSRPAHAHASTVTAVGPHHITSAVVTAAASDGVSDGPAHTDSAARSGPRPGSGSSPTGSPSPGPGRRKPMSDADRKARSLEEMAAEAARYRAMFEKAL
jgi:hypothetical protein